MAAVDEVTGGAGAVGDDVGGGDAMNGGGGEAGALGGVDGPDDGESAGPCGEAAVNMGAKTVVVDEVDLLFPKDCAEGEDGGGDGGDVAHAVRGVDVDGDVEFAEAVGEGAGTQLEDEGLETGAVEVAEEVQEVHLGAADFADAGGPEDFRRGGGGGGLLGGGETHGRRTAGAGVALRRRQSGGRWRLGVNFRRVRMVGGGSIGGGFQKVALKAGFCRMVSRVLFSSRFREVSRFLIRIGRVDCIRRDLLASLNLLGGRVWSGIGWELG